MKYKDYLILPVFIMSLIFLSCTILTATGPDADSGAPVAAVHPEEIVWGRDDNGCGEYWYANGTRGGECFSVRSDERGAVAVCFSGGSNDSVSSKTTGVGYTIDNMHLSCSNLGRKYDFIFLDEMTAYDTISQEYYQRGDSSRLFDSLTSGKFINKDNPNDWYVFKEGGKSLEYFGEKAFPGKWRLETTQSLSVWDKKTGETYSFDLILDSVGYVNGFLFGGVEYRLESSLSA